MKLNKKTKILIVCVGIVIVSCLIIFIVLNYGKKEENKEESKEQTSIEKYNNLLDYAAITSYLNLNSLPDNLYGYFYKEESYKTNEIDNQVKLYMALRNLITETNKGDYSKEISFTEKEVKSKINELFGKNVDFKNESLEGDTCSFSNFKYDSKNKVYVQKPEECITGRTDNIFNEIVSEEMTDESKIITVKVGFIEVSYDINNHKVVYDLYSDISKTQLIISSNGLDPSQYKDMLSNYKFTFTKTKEGNFYLEKVEMVQ